MNPKLSGIIFLIFGLGLFFDTTQELLDNSSDVKIKSILLCLLGVASCIYGIKQIRNKNTARAKDKKNQ